MGQQTSTTGDPVCRHGLPLAFCGNCRRLSAGPAIEPEPARGCICPPGANLTCEAPLCPRKGVPRFT